MKDYTYFDLKRDINALDDSELSKTVNHASMTGVTRVHRLIQINDAPDAGNNVLVLDSSVIVG